MPVGFLDLASGISGDMFLGALVDAGAPLEVMQEAVRAVGGDRLALRAHEVRRAGLRGKQVEVLLDGKKIHESGGPVGPHPNGASDEGPSTTHGHHAHGIFDLDHTLGQFCPSTGSVRGRDFCRSILGLSGNCL